MRATKKPLDGLVERPCGRETETSQSPDLAPHAPAAGVPCCSTLSRAIPTVTS